nr:hypothetical protein [Tanacetum cinerariifolium]
MLSVLEATRIIFCNTCETRKDYGIKRRHHFTSSSSSSAFDHPSSFYHVDHDNDEADEGTSRVNTPSPTTNSIHGVLVEGEWISNPDEIKEEFFKFYKSNSQSFYSLFNANFNLEFVALCLEDVIMLQQQATLDEICKAIWDCGSDKSPEPDGFLFLFLKTNSDLFKYDVADFVNHFMKSEKFIKDLQQITSSFNSIYRALGLKIDILKSNLFGIKRWHIGNAGSFAVASTWAHIDRLMLSSLALSTTWNACLLRKHTFFSCEVASQIWRIIRIWCNITDLLVPTYTIKFMAQECSRFKSQELTHFRHHRLYVLDPVEVPKQHQF